MDLWIVGIHFHCIYLYQVQGPNGKTATKYQVCFTPYPASYVFNPGFIINKMQCKWIPMTH